jgi:transcriptional regulator with XRE-family HTH domain
VQEPKEIVARNIQGERLSRNLSQEDLADLSGLSSVRISQVERAVHDPRLLTIVRIAHGLGIPAADLLRGV